MARGVVDEQSRVNEPCGCTFGAKEKRQVMSELVRSDDGLEVR